MNDRFRRALASLLSLSIFLAAAGPATAGELAAPVSGSVSPVPAAAIAPALGAPGAMPEVSLPDLGGVSAQLPEALAPAAPAVSAASPAAPEAALAGAAPALASPRALAAVSAAPASSAAQAAPAAAAGRSVFVRLGRLWRGAPAQGPADRAAPRSAAARLDEVFDDSRAQGEVSAPVLAAQSASEGSSGLAPASEAGRGGSSSDGPRRGVPTPQKGALKTAAKWGFVSAVAMVAATAAVTTVAAVLGYHFHPGYHMPLPVTHLTPLKSLATLVMASVMAPVAEEMLFRGALMGGIRAATRRIPKAGSLGVFWVPAVLSSLAFVAVHELSDPVLFGARFAGAMILAYAFHKQGFAGSMFSHGFYNGLLVLPLVFAAFAPGIAPLASLAVMPAALLTAWVLSRKLRKQGVSTRFEFKPWQCLLLAGLLMAGFFFLMPNIIWPAGALGWLVYAAMRRGAQKKPSR